MEIHEFWKECGTMIVIVSIILYAMLITRY